MSTVHVLLPVHNRCALTRQFIEDLRLQTFPAVSLLVIDDGSSDGTKDMVLELWPQATVLRGDGGLWWAGSLQRGYEHLLRIGAPDTDTVVIANDDTRFQADFIARGVRLLSDQPGALLCAQLEDERLGQVRETGVHADLLRFRFRIADVPSEINCLPTRGLFLRWGDMRRIGGFRPRLLPHYFSDYEYTLRAHRLGYRCLTDPAVALRANAQTTGFHDLDRLVGVEFVRRLFSIKTPLNPLHRSAFVLLAAPVLAKLPALINVWARALLRIVWQGVAHRPFPRRAPGD